jgi:hypothetical protein
LPLQPAPEALVFGFWPQQPQPLHSRPAVRPMWRASFSFQPSDSDFHLQLCLCHPVTRRNRKNEVKSRICAITRAWQNPPNSLPTVERPPDSNLAPDLNPVASVASDRSTVDCRGSVDTIELWICSSRSNSRPGGGLAKTVPRLATTFQLRSRPDQRWKAGVEGGHSGAGLGRDTSFGDLLQHASQYLDFERW